MIDPHPLQPNHSMQQMRASQLVQLEVANHWRLPRATDASCSACTQQPKGCSMKTSLSQYENT